MLDDRKFARRILLIVFVIGLVSLAVYISLRASHLLVIVFAAWITAETAEIIIRFLMRRKLKRGLAVGLTILFALLLVALLTTIVVPPIIRELIALANEAENIPDLITSGIDGYESFRLTNEFTRTIFPPSPQDFQSLLLGQDGEGSLLLTTAEQVVPVLANIGTFVGVTIGQVVLYIFITILLLLEPAIYYDALLSMVPHRYEKRAGEILRLVRKNVESWSGAILLSISITSTLYFIVLGMILRLPNGLALSAIAGIATIIPTIGNTLAIIPVIIVAAQLGLPTLIAAIILYMVIGTIQDRIITPTIMRSELSIPAAAQVIFQLILATLIGPIGLLLAIPLLAILITLIRELYVVDVLGKSYA